MHFLSHSARPYARPDQQSRWLRAILAWMLLLATLPVAAFNAPAAFAAACAPGGVTILDNVVADPINNQLTFYEDTGITPQLRGMYVGYTVKNNAATTSADIWIKLDSFPISVPGPLDPGRIQLAANEDGVQHVGPLAAGASKQVYFYLADAIGSTDATGLNEPFQVNLYPGDPAILGAGAEVCDYADQIDNIDDSIKAAANAVYTTIAGPNPAAIGGVMTLTVVGETGTVGDTQGFALSPAAVASWPANAYQMTDVHVDYYWVSSGGGVSCPDKVGGLPTSPPNNLTQFDDVLYFIAPSPKSACYKVTYSFIATGATTGPTSVSATNYINSGTQFKHTDPDANGLFSSIQPANNKTTLTKSVSPTNLPAGGTAGYTITFNNTYTGTITLDSISDVMPSGATYINNSSSSTCTATAIGDPSISGLTLTWFNLPIVPAGSTCSVTYQATIPNSAGSYTNSVTSKIGSTQIDTTLLTTDNAPGTATVTVGTPALSLSKSDGGATTTPGGMVTYALGYQNTGTLPLTGVTLSETVPANTTFNAAASTATWSCANGAVAGTICTYTVGNLAVGVSGAVNFAVTVNSSVPAGTIQISNSASVTSTQGASAPATDTTPLTTAPALSLTKSDGGLSTTPGGTVTGFAISTSAFRNKYFRLSQ